MIYEYGKTYGHGYGYGYGVSVVLTSWGEDATLSCNGTCSGDVISSHHAHNYTYR